MKCPDINRLIDWEQAGGVDEGIQVHLRTCDSCRSALHLIRELPAAFQPEIEVPEHLVQRTLAAVMETAPAADRPHPVPIHGFIAGVLASVSTFLVIAVTGSVGTGGMKGLILFSLAMGVVASLWESRLPSQDHSG